VEHLQRFIESSTKIDTAKTTKMPKKLRIVFTLLVLLGFCAACEPTVCECYVIFSTELEKDEYPSGVSGKVRDKYKPSECIEKHKNLVPIQEIGTELYYETLIERLGKACEKKQNDR
jgi:hypothetical protein